jgi:tetratricopeptide (TPR) repeat protein
MIALVVLMLVYLPKSWRRPFFILSPLLIGILAYVFRESLRKYLEIDVASFASTVGRISIWKTDLLAILDSPLIGHGVGNFEYTYMKFHQPSSELLRYFRTTIFAHNGMLQTAVDSGLPSLAALLAGLAAILTLSFKSVGNFFQNSWAAAVLLVYGVTSLFNYSLFLPYNGLVFSAGVGVLLSTIKLRYPGIEVGSKRLCFGMFIALFGIFLFCLGVSQLYANGGDLRRAARWMPFKADYWYSMAMDRLTQADGGTPGALEQALPLLRKAASANPNDAFVWSRLARVYASRNQPGDSEQSQICFEKAELLAPKHAPFWIEHGIFLAQANRFSEAAGHFKQAMLLEPAAPVPLYWFGLAQLSQRNSAVACQALEDARQIKRNQGQIESASAYHRESIASAYGQFLFGIDVALIEAAMARCETVRRNQHGS